MCSWPIRLGGWGGRSPASRHAPPISSLRYEWPGNVRELQNAIEHAVALAAGNRVEVDDLPEELRGAMPRPRPTGSTRPLEDVEREYILAAVESAGGNRTRAAAELGIGLATLKRKLKQYAGST